MENADFWAIGLYMRSVGTNSFYLLRRLLGNDVDKLRAVLIDLDFRHLD